MIEDRDKATAAIREAAANWVVRMSTSALNIANENDFFDWLRRSPEHVKEYLRAEATWQALDDAAKSDTSNVQSLMDATPANVWSLHPRRTGSMSGAANAVDSPTHVRGRQRLRLSGRIVALSAAGGLLIALGLAFVPGLMERFEGDTYATGVGELRRVALEDGSVVELNTSSLVRVRLTDEARTIDLQAGEAFFQVAKDPSRPFRVISDTVVVSAVGTQFNVYRMQQGTSVTVVEGRVAVEVSRTPVTAAQFIDGDGTVLPEAESLLGMPGRSADKHPGKSPGSVELAAGQSLLVAAKQSDKSVETPLAEINPAVATAWRQRRLIFQNQTLAQVVAEFNRYNRQQLVIEDAALAQERISGTFDPDKPEALVRFLRQQSHVTSMEESDRTLLRPPG